MYENENRFGNQKLIAFAYEYGTVETNQPNTG